MARVLVQKDVVYKGIQQQRLEPTTHADLLYVMLSSCRCLLSLRDSSLRRTACTEDVSSWNYDA